MMMKKPPQVLKGLILLLTLLCFFIPQESVQAALIIATDMTWSGAVSVDRDEAVKNGVILTVEPGTIITLACTDSEHYASGYDPERVEIIIEDGTMNDTEATFKGASATAGC